MSCDRCRYSSATFCPYCGRTSPTRSGLTAQPKSTPARRVTPVKAKPDERWLLRCQYERCGRKFHAARTGISGIARHREGADRPPTATALRLVDGPRVKDIGVDQNREYAPTNTGGPDPGNVTPVAGKGG